jgi:hypothetical protein
MSAELPVSKVRHPLLHAAVLREICPLSTWVSAGRLPGKATAGHSDLRRLFCRPYRLGPTSDAGTRN